MKIVKPQSEAERHTQTTTDTWDFTPDQAKKWKLPPFQRPLRINDKVLACSNEIKANDGVIPGIFTIGKFQGDIWLVDGQHRREAFFQSGCQHGYVDVRILHFATMGEMAEEFVRLNSQIAKMKPDDVVRGLEASYEPLQKLRKRCPYVGYDNIRRNEKAPVLSMAQCLRGWQGSANESPRSGGVSAAQLAQQFSMDDCEQLGTFLQCAFAAWGKDAANARLWGGLNLTLCMWLYRRLVIQPYSAKTARITPETFTKCLMSLGAAELYVEWLVGRQISSSRDIAPAYTRIKGLFATRLEADSGRKALLPAPTWATHGGSKK